MCGNCGCDQPKTVEVVNIERNILEKNDLQAEQVRGYLQGLKSYACNMMSSPGSGKTTLLERMVEYISKKRACYVIEGDQQTSNDAQRIAALGIPAIQINTGSGCHLEANRVMHALQHLNPEPESIIFIENVGNLVCPAVFDLGEHDKIVVISPTEGEDKPLKYPKMFEESSVCVINKLDLAPYLDVDLSLLEKNIAQVNPDMQIFSVSAKTGEGIKEVCEWVLAEHRKRCFHVDEVDFFDRKAQTWDVDCPLNEENILKTLKTVPLSQAKAILDAGCGTGNLISILHQLAPNAHITGLDRSSKMLDVAKSKYMDLDYVSFTQGDIEKEDIERGFDYVFLFSVFPHLTQKSRTLHKIIEKLNPQGEIIILHDCSSEKINQIHQHAGHEVAQHALLPAGLQAAGLKKMGLQVVEFHEDQDGYLIRIKK